MTIIAAYLTHEAPYRAKAGRLLPEDVLRAVAETARELGVTETEVKDAIRAHSAQMWG